MPGPRNRLDPSPEAHTTSSPLSLTPSARLFCPPSIPSKPRISACAALRRPLPGREARSPRRDGAAVLDAWGRAPVNASSGLLQGPRQLSAAAAAAATRGLLLRFLSDAFPQPVRLGDARGHRRDGSENQKRSTGHQLGYRQGRDRNGRRRRNGRVIQPPKHNKPLKDTAFPLK